VRAVAPGIADGDGWTPVEMEVPGGAERVSEVVAWLALEGVPVSRVEPARTTLAGVIEHVLARAGMHA